MGSGFKRSATMNKKYYFIFALLDIFSVIYYIIIYLWQGKIPFYSDWLQMMQVVNDFGMNGLVCVLFLSTLIIYPTLILSAWYYLKQNNFVKWIALLQTPLRTIVLVSSIPFFYNIFSWLGPKANNELTDISIVYYSFTLILGLMIEIGKNIFLFKKK